jgi:tripartite-type tricarboxylate transporter receptor subunit TctC
VLAPVATPRAVIDKLNRASNAAMQSPEIHAKLTSQGVIPEAMTPEQLGEKIRTETARWGKVVKAAGLKAQ